MLIIMVVGLGSAFTIQRAMFPSVDIEVIFITAPYPGAAPEEVEQGVVLKIEEAINDLDGIKRVESDAYESFARIMIEPNEGIDLGKLLDEVQNRINAIQHFPDGAEEPIVRQPELLFPTLTLQLSGNIDERALKSLADEMRRELLSLPEVSSAEVVGARDYEISVEISEQLLREYHLTLGDVADIIAASSLDIPAGSVQTRNGDIMLRTLGQAYVQRDFEEIVLKTWPDGTRLLLGDIATIDDGFVDGNGFTTFDGQYSLGINVFAMGKQDIIDTAQATRDYMEQKRGQLPEGVTLDAWQDITYYLKERLGMMLKNLAVGALLVFIVLALFLEIKLAFWVMLGIPVCFLGAMAVISTPLVDASLDLLSIFGFIIALGIIVDDAIVMGESAYAEQERHGHSVQSVVSGVYQVATPATFGVLTTIVAFMPTLFVEGVFGAFPEACGIVVVLCLALSLLESKWILPAHLAHSKPSRHPLLMSMNRVQQHCNQSLRDFVDRRYTPFMQRCVENRYVTLAFFISLLILCGGLLAGGQVRTVLAPEARGEFLKAELRLAHGSPEERTRQAISSVANALMEIDEEYQRETGGEEKLVAHIAAYGFEQINGRISVELTKEDQRSLTTREVEQRWRDRVGTIHGAEVLAISGDDEGGWGPAIAFDLMHHDFNKLKAASEELEEALRHYVGVYDIRNGAGDTADEFHLDILPEAESLGLTRYDLGIQVRHAFYGAEAQRVQRGPDEIKVMVRYPKADREMTSSLSNMFIRTPQGDEVPFDTVADLKITQGLLKTTHIDFQRASEVTAEADKTLVEPSRVMDEIEENVIPALLEKYPGLSYGISGMADEERKLGVSLMIGFALAIFGIYALLAIPTKSYLQPLIIMGVIPFGIIGAIVGHWVTGYAFSMMSMIGVIALSGVVVNDSLLLVDHTNNAVAAGACRYTAVVEATQRRFRAIMLTSVTTFMGLAPILIERSVQAQDIIPMAISLAFGIVFATVITLLLVPCLYVMLDDLLHWWAGTKQATAATQSGAGERQELVSE
ncbi:MAG: efflux RND transporter permease subunit [Pseudomonadales bacterium]|nr:efflux RND transporter permease subunit [Pseudomonadales bacterium]